MFKSCSDSSNAANLLFVQVPDSDRLHPSVTTALNDVLLGQPQLLASSSQNQIGIVA